jgi:hypothetical protein
MFPGAPYFAASAIQLLRDSKLGLLVTSNTCSTQTNIAFCDTWVVACHNVTHRVLCAGCGVYAKSTGSTTTSSCCLHAVTLTVYWLNHRWLLLLACSDPDKCASATCPAQPLPCVLRNWTGLSLGLVYSTGSSCCWRLGPATGGMCCVLR